MKALATFAALLIIGTGIASAATDTKPKAAAVHSPESIECSKQADAKGLHGAERKKFRAKCKKELKESFPRQPPRARRLLTDNIKPRREAGLSVTRSTYD